MNFDYYFDTAIGMTHIEKHGVSQTEIEEFFEEVDYLVNKRKDGSFATMGKMKSGRYLKVVYRRKGETHFIITAYDLESPVEIQIVEDHLEGLS
jgi:uncharacterized DUF497 family protein